MKDPIFGWPSQWDLVQSPEAPEEAAALLHDCVYRRRPTMINAISAAHKAKHKKRAAHLARRYVASDSAWLSEFLICLKREGSTDDVEPADIPYLIALALDEDVRWGRIPPELSFGHKKDGGARPYFRFDAIEQARSRLFAMAAKHSVRLHPRQFLFQGGLTAASAWLQSELPQAKYVIIVDFPSCFLTINRDCVESALPFAREDTRRVLFDPMDQAITLLPTASHGDDREVLSRQRNVRHILYHGGVEPRRGLPPGAAFSPIANEIALRAVLQTIEDATKAKAAAYADNLIILASDGDAVLAAEEALMSYVERKFGKDVMAQLRRRLRRYPKGQRFFWIGSEFQLRQGQVVRRVPTQKIDCFYGKTMMDFAAAMQSPKNTASEVKRQFRKKILGWLAHNKHDRLAAQNALQLLIFVKNT